MTEYQITVYFPGGGVYFRTEWREDATVADGMLVDLGATFGTEVVELVSRKLSRAGYDYETIVAAEVWHGGTL